MRITHGKMRYGRRKQSRILPVILIILLCAGAALGLTYFWHYSVQRSGVIPVSKDSETGDTYNKEDTPDIPDTPDTEDIQTSTDGVGARRGVNQGLLNIEGALMETPAVGDNYFDDAVFVGDSITDGIKAYGLMNNTTVIANKGLNPSTILTDPKIKVDSGYVTVLDALAKVKPAKIYVMQGGNGIAWFSQEQMMSLYGDLLDAIIAMHPESIIYVQSILPVTAAYSNTDNGISNDKIDEYNVALSALAKEKDVYFLDVASALKDETGALPEEASPVDGMHFGPTYYQKWFDYLKCHAVQELPTSAEYSIIDDKNMDGNSLGEDAGQEVQSAEGLEPQARSTENAEWQAVVSTQ